MFAIPEQEQHHNGICGIPDILECFGTSSHHHDFSYSRPFSVDASPAKWSRASVLLCCKSFLIRKLCIIITTVNRHYYSDDEITSTFRMPENFYTTLGIDSKASETDIRKAYRKLAIKWHPDKNPTNLHVANEKFKAIAEAYEVLSDEGKRSQYDGSLGGRRADTQRYQQSSDPLRGFDFSSDYSGRRAQDIFDQFFSTFQNDFFDSPFPHQQFHQQQPQRGEGAYREHNSREYFQASEGLLVEISLVGATFSVAILSVTSVTTWVK